MQEQGASSNRLRELRRQHGLKLREVAALVGRSESLVTRYENGQTSVPDEIKRILARRYDVAVDHLMGWDRDEVRAG